MILLISGSREASEKMIAIARKITLHAITRKWIIVVGDAEGIDEIVINVCNHANYSRIKVFGAYGRMRRKSIRGVNVVTNGTYPQRDEAMAISCKACIGIWNGVSRGTMITVDAATALGKPTILYDDRSGKWKRYH